MKKRPLGLLLLAALILIGGVWLAVGGGEDPLREAVMTAQPGSAPEAVAPEESTQLKGLPTEVQVADAQRNEAPEEQYAEVGGVSAGRAGWWAAPRESHWVHGRVERPEGTPGDETLWVTAEGSRFSENADSRDTHTVIAADDGTFRVAFSSRTHRKGKLWVRGRYCYMDRPLWVKLADLDEEVVLEPKLGGRVLVKVLPPRAVGFEPGVLEGLTVQAVRGSFPSRSVTHGWARDEGRFEIGGLAPNRGHEIRVRSERYADGEVEGVEVEPGGSTEIDVPLTLGATVSGTVTDSKGVLLEGAMVFQVSPAAAARRLPFFKTNPEGEVFTHAGHFELVGVPAGDRVLIVEAEGHLETQMDLVALGEGERRLGLDVRLDGGRMVAGVVLWPDGSPAVGATVRIAQSGEILGMDLERVKGEVEVGPDGAFEFSALEDGSCNVTASAIHPDDRPDPGSKVSRLKSRLIPRWMTRVEDVAPGSLQLTLTLTSGNVLTGKVVNDQGEPVKAFKVIASPEGGGMMSADSMKPVRGKFKGEAGEFALQGVQPGRWEVRVTATGYGDSERQKVRIPGTDQLHFVVPRTAVLKGVVRGPDGSGMEGARVIVKHGGSKSTAVDAGSKGKFIAGNIEPGQVIVSADADGCCSSEPYTFQVAAGGEREGLVLVLGPGAVIVAEIHPSAGERAGRLISLSGATSMRLETDSGGRARFEGLDAGNYTVSLSPADPQLNRRDWVMRIANSKKAQVEVLEGEEVSVVLGEPSPTAVKVTGLVTSGGQPLGEAIVMATPDQDGQNSPTAGVRANGAGEFEIIIDDPGDWRFQVGRTSRELVTFRESIPVSEEVTVNFILPEGRIEGAVTGPGGRAQAGLRVTLSPGEGEGRPDFFSTRRATTSDLGEFTFSDLEPGTYVLWAGGTDGWGVAQKGEHLGRILVDVELEYADQTVRQDLALPTAGEITGFVLDASGDPVTGARVEVTDAAGHKLSIFSNVRSGADGSFIYKGVAPGTYTVVARQGKDSPPETVKLYEGGSESVQLTLSGA